MTLVVDRRGAKLTLGSPGVVRVEYPDQQRFRVGLAVLRKIVLCGEIELSSGLLRACWNAGVGVMLLPGRGGGEGAPLLPEIPGRVRLRAAQYRCYLEPSCRLRIARRLVRAKIGGQAKWLMAQGETADFDEFLTSAGLASDLCALMGVEGAAAARYFGAWQHLWDAKWGFRGRNRRPPRDPVNALLSLGYTLEAHEIGRMAASRGLDPCVGFLHEPLGVRPALALDLLEPVRPWVDQWVWQFLAAGALEPAHFVTTSTTGCRLGKEGRGIFFAAWHQAEQEWLPHPGRGALAMLLSALRPHTGGPVLKASAEVVAEYTFSE